ncbi:NUDIX domain-containing protein [Candidatus Woesearchaeota archaeon]|nr:NUDIX domain-containing protein [Candidatus Woesearchaeota archaeon]
MDEWIDIVNDQDQVIGRTRRSICHQKRLLHRRVAVLIFRDNSLTDTLIQRRSKHKDIAPGKLAHLEGHVRSGENYFQAALREIKEEMLQHLKLSQYPRLKKLFKFKSALDNDNVFITVYRMVLPGPFHSQPEEVTNYRFVNIHKLIKDIKLHPRRYTGTCRLLFLQYEEEFLTDGRDH